jgi:hypothetical protein
LAAKPSPPPYPEPAIRRQWRSWSKSSWRRPCGTSVDRRRERPGRRQNLGPWNRNPWLTNSKPSVNQAGPTTVAGPPWGHSRACRQSAGIRRG